jgi:hypothetical protein
MAGIWWSGLWAVSSDAPQDSEKGKVLQNIASVIQALHPVEAMVVPILQRLGAALGR